MDLVKRYPAGAPPAQHGVTLDDIYRCARPIHFELDDETCKYSGNGSSFIAVVDQTWILFTAAHVINDADPASLRVLPTDGSRRWLNLKRRVRAASLIDGDTDLADVMCFTIDTSDLKLAPGDALRGVDLGFPTASPRPGDELFITGHPAASRHVDYEGRGIIAIGQSIGAQYVGRGIGARCHEVALTQIGNLEDLDGFSGSAVYWIGERDGDVASVRLAGMLLRGSATSHRAYYVETSVLMAIAETASTGRPTYLTRRRVQQEQPQHD
jgi:hypothetical protein